VNAGALATTVNAWTFENYAREPVALELLAGAALTMVTDWLNNWGGADALDVSTGSVLAHLELIRHRLDDLAADDLHVSREQHRADVAARKRAATLAA
jgi:hypothetical protein